MPSPLLSPCRTIAAALGLLAIAGVVHAERAQGQTCDVVGPFVELSIQGQWSGEVTDTIAAELRTALAVRRIELCVGSLGNSDSIAQVLLERESAQLVTITITDTVTGRNLDREVDLSQFRDGAQTLAIAIAIDEMMRASWMEVILERAEAQLTEPTPQEEEPIQEPTQEPVEPRPAVLDRSVWLDVVGAFDLYSGGEGHLGGSLALELWFVPTVAFRLDAGARVGIKRTGVLGSVQSRSPRVDLSFVVGLLGHSRDGTHLVGRLGGFAAWLFFSAEAAEGAIASDENSIVVGLQASLGLRHSFGPFRILADVGLGYPLSGATALDGDDGLSSATGPSMFALAGFGVAL